MIKMEWKEFNKAQIGTVMILENLAYFNFEAKISSHSTIVIDELEPSDVESWIGTRTNYCSADRHLLGDLKIAPDWIQEFFNQHNKKG